MKVIIDGIEYVPKQEKEPSYFTVADVFYHYEEAKEYEGIVRTIQNWFYGYEEHAPWCATSMSWALGRLGLMQYTIGKKYENVFMLNNALLKSCAAGKCLKVAPNEMKYGDIVILSFGTNFSITSAKHVTTFVEKCDTIPGAFKGIGGNQDDKICVKSYIYADIVNAFRPHYELGTLKNLGDLPNA